MNVVFDHRDPGTPEALWSRTLPWSDAAELDDEVDRLVVVAAHPDDETLGAGGLLWKLDHAGAEVSVIIATDGEASHPADDPTKVARTRRQEVVAALAELAPRARLRFLGLPDGGLDRHRGALRTALEEELGDDPWRVLVAAPWRGDGHRDHRVAGEEAAAFACAGVRVVGYPVWLWHWGEPSRVDATAWVRLPLPEHARAAKERALAQYRSQLQGSGSAPPMLHDGMLAHFRRDHEVFVTERAPTRPSAALPDFDERFRAAEDPWGFRTRWYERRKRAVLLSALPRERFADVLELGCANGVLTRALADRAAHVVAVDGSVEALRRARMHLADDPRVVFDRLTVPREWPDGRFDLVVVSEIGYYWSAEDLTAAIARIDESLAPDGVVALCHWRYPVSDAPSTADLVHAAFQAAPAWVRTVRHVEDDFLLDVHTRPGLPSVAAAEALA